MLSGFAGQPWYADTPRDRKKFGSKHALRGVDLAVKPGTIHGIAGENGAGKSTLMKVLTGFILRDGGTISQDGRPVQLDSPRAARRLGIGMLYQEPLDFPGFTVLDSWIAGADRFVPARQCAQLLRLGGEFAFSLDPSRQVGSLTLGERQQLELLRLIDQGTRILILDEPTTGISESQRQLLFGALQRLCRDGAAVLLVSHKLEEIEQLCDQVTVLRHGRVTALVRRPFSRSTVLTAMFGDAAPALPPAPHPITGPEVFACDNVSCRAGRAGCSEVSLTVGAGEVIGLAGVDGSGQGALLRAACGLLPVDSGWLRCCGKIVQTGRMAERKSVVFLPADRLAEGLFSGMSVREHQLLANGRQWLLGKKSGLAAAEQAIHAFAIRGAPETPAENLSGGNQQRLLLSLIPAGTRLLLMENPTRGLDIQSAAWTWQYLHQHRPADGAIMFASPDLEEILSQASRVLVLFAGRIVLDQSAATLDYHQLSAAVTGQLPAAAA